MPKFTSVIAALAASTAMTGAVAALTASSPANATPNSSFIGGDHGGWGWGHGRHRHKNKVRVWIHNNNNQHQHQAEKQDQDQDQDQCQFRASSEVPSQAANQFANVANQVPNVLNDNNVSAASALPIQCVTAGEEEE